jgi:Flp pilus assembly pilin Flp
MNNEAWWLAESFRQLWNDCRAVTVLEYGLIAAVAGSIIAIGFRTYGTALKAAFLSLVV